MENRPSRRFFREQSAPVALRILALQSLEPEHAACAEAAYPSEGEEWEAFILRLENAANFYRELLALFQIRYKQDLASPDRKRDWEKAENLYGKCLREISLALRRLKAQSFAPVTRWPEGSSKSPSRAETSKSLAVLRQREKELQASYFKRVSALTSSVPSVTPPAVSGDNFQSREMRKQQWLEEAHAWGSLRKELDAIFDSLLAARRELAVLLGYENYFQILERKSPPGLPESFGQIIAAPCRSALLEMHRQRKKRLKLGRLRAYDMNTHDFCGFKGAQDWREKTRRLLNDIHPEFAAIFRGLEEEALLDPLPAPGKAPGAFCQPLPHSGKAYLFLNLRGTRKDLMTGIHEVGHALHACLAFSGKQGGSRQIQPACGEFFALTLELLALEHLDAFYPDATIADWAVRKHAESILNAFTSYLTIDEFERNIYRGSLAAGERRVLFASISSKNLGLIDYSGHESVLEDWAFRIPLLVSSPGYFRNYSVTLLGALYYYEGVRKGLFTPDAFAALMRTQGCAPLDVVFEEIGFSAGPGTVKRLMAAVARLGGA